MTRIDQTFKIRAATGGDATFLRALFALPHVRGWLHPPRSFVFEQGDHAIVERDGQPFGYMLLDRDPEWLLSIRVLAAWEPRRGAGRFALEYAKSYGFGDLGVHRIFLEVVESNAPCRRLCERFGFRAEGVYRDGYRDESGAFHDLIPYGLIATDADSARHQASRAPIARIDHVQLAMPAGGEEPARSFYVNALGFTEQPKPPQLAGRGGVWFASGTVFVHLGVEHDFRPASKAHPAFGCADYHGLMAQLRALGIPIFQDGNVPSGELHCYVTDPFGNRIELVDE
jgi:catechol 2,3-dioxygenase-like lactoylglutathione lyase family enzyme